MKLSQDLKVGDKVYKAGTECPASEEERLVLKNRDYLELEYKDGLPVVPEKYKSYFNGLPKPKMKIKAKTYSQESLTVKMNELGAKKFKEWAEKEFGEDAIDRRKTAKAIINDILVIQERDRQ